MLREVHGRPQLYISQAEDAGPPWGHHLRHLLLVGLRVRGRVPSGELAALREEVIKEAPDTKKSTGSFESVEGSKQVLVDPGSTEGKTVCISTMLSFE